MDFKLPKNEKYQWTRHSVYKMRQYGLSPQRITRVIRNPERTEEGIVPKTIACMQRASTNKKSGEIWCMYQLRGSGTISKSQFPISNKNPKSKFQNLQTSHPALSPLGRGGKGKIKIISAWRYPGISPKNNPIPEEILREIKSLL